MMPRQCWLVIAVALAPLVAGCCGGAANAPRSPRTPVAHQPAAATPSSGLRFVAWADTRGDTPALAKLAKEVSAHAPAFTIYPGDLVPYWDYKAEKIKQWREALTVPQGTGTSDRLFRVTFPVRGNRDGGKAGWDSWMGKNHPMAEAAKEVGATHFATKSGAAQRVYSFDHGKVHVVGLDFPGDLEYVIADDQLTWLEADLKAAEARKVAHTFLFFHGPIYCMYNHCSCIKETKICGDNNARITRFVKLLNTYKSISATFHGHEHLYVYTLVDKVRDSRLEVSFRQFIVGAAGKGPLNCPTSNTHRYDYCHGKKGYITVDVKGARVTVSFYQLGSDKPVKIVSYTKK